MTTPADWIANLRGVAQFYRDSPNTSEEFVNVYGADGDYHLTSDDLFAIADWIERRS